MLAIRGKNNNVHNSKQGMKCKGLWWIIGDDKNRIIKSYICVCMLLFVYWVSFIK